MTLGRFATRALTKLFNNFLHALHFIGVLEVFLFSFLQDIFFPIPAMDGDGGEQQDHVGPQQQQQQAEPMDEDVGEVMGLGYDDDDVDVEIIEDEDDANDSDDMSNDDDEDDSDYILDMDSEDDDAFESDQAAGYRGDYSTNSESDSDMDKKYSRSYWVTDPRQRSRTISPYTFKPHRLLKCNYKKFCPPRDYPFERSGHRVVATESNLFMLGGYNPRNSGAITQSPGMLFQELWRYNFGTKRWVQLYNPTVSRSMPRELASNALIISNNLLISYGGTGHPFGEACSNHCYVFQTQGENPTIMRIEATGDAPTPQYGPGIVLHDHYLYAIGGTTGYEYSCDVHRLNLRTRVWECVYICRPDIREDPQGRYRHEVVYDGHYIYVLGGGTSNLVYDLQRIPAFNIKANRWDYIDTLADRSVQTNAITLRQNLGYPKPRKCFSCVQHTNSNGDVEAFITGGLQVRIYISSFPWKTNTFQIFVWSFSYKNLKCVSLPWERRYNEDIYFSDIWKINFTTKQWTQIKTATLPKALYFHAAAHNQNGCMYIFGGIEYDGKMRRCNDLYKMWMTIPKLSEICWEAVLHYRPNLKFHNHSQLLKMGIPLQFAQRLWHSSRIK